ncbi:MAG: preprotein translocase subunit YajC [Phycisphaerae bacterium]|nr:preprotein translocase subunit YajC [Phycisphaerae bacterium]
MLIIGLFYLLILRPRRVEEQKHRSMIGALKKNDRVVTIGGMLGTVVAVKDDEVTLKIDESTNTKVTFLRSAIKSVIAVAPGESKPS